ncbi:MAG: hypothetical protein DWI69_06665 [Chloroflexi bacterium]|nr:MAG: hypothetical protein DWI69_06665 [Chloroflexota bacterium]
MPGIGASAATPGDAGAPGAGATGAGVGFAGAGGGGAGAWTGAWATGAAAAGGAAPMSVTREICAKPVGGLPFGCGVTAGPVRMAASLRRSPPFTMVIAPALIPPGPSATHRWSASR